MGWRLEYYSYWILNRSLNVVAASPIHYSSQKKYYVINYLLVEFGASSIKTVLRFKYNFQMYYVSLPMEILYSFLSIVTIKIQLNFRVLIHNSIHGGTYLLIHSYHNFYCTRLFFGWMIKFIEIALVDNSR